jgi:hypothetical protein
MTSDFLKRTGERALGQATVMTPLLASTYQPGGGFGLESALTIAMQWPAPADPGAVLPPPRPARASVPDARLPRLSPPEPIETRPAGPSADPGPSLPAPAPPSSHVELPTDESKPKSVRERGAEPMVTPLAREERGARPITSAPPRQGTARVAPSLAEPPLPAADPTLAAVEALRPLSVEQDAPASQPPAPAFEAPRPGTRTPQRSAARRPEAAANADTERELQPTLDAVRTMRPTSARVVAAETARTLGSASAPLPLLRLPPTPSRRLDPDSQRADDSPPVRVTIGRVEIRGDSPPPPPPSSPPSRLALTLDEYLRTRGGVA